MARKKSTPPEQPVTQNASLTIKTIVPGEEAPKRRIESIEAALTAYSTLVNADLVGGRGIRFGNIAGLFAGFPPTPPSEMERQGLGDMPNVNTREFEGAVNDYTDVWNAVNSSNLEFAEVEADLPEDKMQEQARSQYLTKCFNWALQIWNDPPRDGFFNNSGRYILESSIRDTQMGLFSVGVSFFRDPIDFRFKTIPTRNFLVPEGTDITLDNCPLIVIQDNMTAADLWAMRDKEGWDKTQIERLIYCNAGARTSVNWDRQTFGQWVEWVRENTSFILTDFTPIPFNHMYVKEFDGRISHICFSTDQPASNQMDKTGKTYGERNFLYNAPESKWVSTWTQCACVFSDNVGAEGKYHGAKGFGDRNYDMCHFNNLMFNRGAIAAIQRNMLLFQSNNEADRQRLQQVTVTPGAILYPELQLNQVKLDTDVAAALSVFDLATRVRNVNNRKFPVGERSRSGEAPTATQVTSDTAKEAQFTSLQISFYRATGLDKLLAEMYRRIAQPGSKYPENWPGGKVAKRFREKCKEFGIPEEDLLKVRMVRANRNSGSGNMNIDLLKGKELLAVATPGEGQFNARREIVSALKGADMVDTFVQPPPEQPNELMREINHENLYIQDAKNPMVLPNDLHEIHVAQHMPVLDGLSKVVAQFMEQGVTPQNLDDAVALNGKLEAGIEHVGQHVQFMASIPRTGKQPALFESLVKESAKTLGNLAQMSQAFGRDIAKVAQEQQQNQQQQSPEMLKAITEAQALMLKTQAEIQAQQAKMESKLGNDAMKSAARTESLQREHDFKLGLKAQESVADQQMRAAQSAQDLQAQQIQTAQQLISNAAMADQKLAEEQAKAAAPKEENQ